MNYYKVPEPRPDLKPADRKIMLAKQDGHTWWAYDRVAHKWVIDYDVYTDFTGLSGYTGDFIEISKAEANSFIDEWYRESKNENCDNSK